MATSQAEAALMYTPSLPSIAVRATHWPCAPSTWWLRGDRRV